MEIIALYNLKGGVGKTTGCVNLAYAAARDGFRTLLWDLDAQGAASFFLGDFKQQQTIKKTLSGDVGDLNSLIQATDYSHLSVIPADITARNMDILLNEKKGGKRTIKQLLQPLKKDFDFIFLDCPPGFSVLADSVFHAADFVLMPTIPTTLSVRTYQIVKDYFENNKVDTDKLMCYFNMVDIRKNLHLEVMQTYARDHRFFQFYIPTATEIEKMGLHQQPILVAQPNSRGAHSFLALWQEMKEGLVG